MERCEASFLNDYVKVKELARLAIPKPKLSTGANCLISTVREYDNLRETEILSNPVLAMCYIKSP